jgi:vacuolar-type H+-ATPase subunit C/Vma6
MLRRSVSKHIFRRGPDDSSYHTKYYDLRNVSVVIIGKVSHVRLLQVLQTKVESSILAKRTQYRGKGVTRLAFTNIGLG